MKIRKYIFLLLLLGCVLMVPGPADLQILASKVKPPLVLVLDAGHGGPDGGASAYDGTLEKTLNLEIVQALEKEARRCGIEVVLTRECDDGLYAEENAGGPWKKIEDMQRRNAIIEESKADLVISIHLNSFPADSNVRGAQVFYPKKGDAALCEKSEALAKEIQQSLLAGLEDGSNRAAATKEGIYLFRDIKVPTVLVECGFLSNGEDLANLKLKAYQEKLAVCIIKAVAEEYNIGADKQTRTKEQKEV